jgi:DNA primase catalytic core, N-terminal domain
VSSVEFALERLGLDVKRVGGRLWTERCPLPTHQAHNPKHRWANFFVRPEGERAGQWHCYSCGAGGRLVELVMRLREVDFREAREWLRTIEEHVPPKPFLRVRVDSRRKTFRLPDGVEGGALSKWNSVPRDYVKSRGITAEQVERWRIGYALMGRLEGRIVFPVFDAKGRLVNYTGRTFVGDDVRYLSAHEREFPDTSAFWGEHRWTDRKTVLLFEGAINGLAFERACERAGLMPSLAGMSGKHFDYRKALRLRFERVVVATDPDPAGDLAHAHIESTLRSACEVVRFQYPTSDDAAATSPGALTEAVRKCLA